MSKPEDYGHSARLILGMQTLDKYNEALGEEKRLHEGSDDTHLPVTCTLQGSLLLQVCFYSWGHIRVSIDSIDAGCL